MKKHLIYLVLSAFLGACGGNETSQKSENVQKPDTTTQEKTDSVSLGKVEFTEGAKMLSENTNTFATNFYSRLKNSPETKNKNLFFSPVGLHTALGMLQIGTSNQGKEELSKTLLVEKVPTLPASYYHLQGSLLQNLEGNATIQLANAVLLDDRLKVQPHYIKDLKQYFKAEAFSGKLSDKVMVGKINDWAKQQTKGAIPQLVDMVSDSTRLILLNAIYFKSTWAEGFDFMKAKTKYDYFTLTSQAKVNALFMNKTGDFFRYYEDEKIQLVALPYKNHQTHLYIILPKEQVSLASVEDEFDYSKVEKWINAMKRVEAERLSIPKIKMETKFIANEILKNMGAKSIFDPFDGTHLQKIADSLYVGKVLHKTFLDINEEGTEAVAITGIEEKKTESKAFTPPKKFTFIANRPFLFFIREANLGTILFMGRVMNPLEN